MRTGFLVCCWLLGACSRVSTPPPASDSSAAPVAPSAAAAIAAPTASLGSAEAAFNPPPPPTTSTPVVSTAAPAASSPPAAEDCARFETSAEHRDLSAEERARSVMTCRAKEELRAFVAARQSCSAATECAIVAGSCPFGCFLPVAKASAPEVVAKLGALGGRLDDAGNRCVYRCMSPPAATCVQGRCSTGKP